MPWLDVDIAIAGAGIAGASVAWELARRGAVSVAVLEREPVPSSHASGRNAALIRQNVNDPVACELARWSVRWHASPPAGLTDLPGIKPVGSLLLATGPDGERRLARDVERVRSFGVDVSLLSPAEVAARVPVLDMQGIHGGAFCPSDGVIDIALLVPALLKGARARGVHYFGGCRIEGVIVENGAVRGVATNQGDVRCRTLVNAAGAWAGRLGDEAGAPLPLRPTRRHLVVTPPIPEVNPGWPFTWDVDNPFYFRPESGGLLLCACDMDDAADLRETVVPRWIGHILAEARRRLPRVQPIEAAWTWAGLRTLTPDERFIIGPDPRLKGLFWTAGLGGHGITSAPAIGRIAADLLLDGRCDWFDASRLSAERFTSGARSAASP